MPAKPHSKRTRQDEPAREETPASDHSEEQSAEESEEDNEEPNDSRVSDPYSLLGVKSDATAAEIKTAYKKIALKNHPDKVKGDKDEATKKFQDITRAYAILSDETRRRIFDQTGSTERAASFDKEFNWTDFCNAQFQSFVDLKMLDKLKAEYQGTEEERNDLLSFFEQCKGNLNRVFEHVIFSNVLDDEERFRAIIDEAIKDDKVKAYPAYTEEPEEKRQRRYEKAQKEAKEAEQEQKKMKRKKEKDGDMDLAALIQGRQKSRMDDFISGLEAQAKALEQPKKKKRKTAKA